MLFRSFVDVSRFSRELQGARFASKTGDGLRRRRYQSGGFETEFAVLMSANLDDGGGGGCQMAKSSF